MKIRKIITKGLLATSILGVAATLSNTAYTASGTCLTETSEKSSECGLK